MFSQGKQQTKELENQIYRLELKHLRKKTIFVSVILFVLIFPTVLILFLFDIPLLDIFVYFLVFTLIITINSIFYFYRNLLPNIYLSMYITTFGLYVISFALILDIQSASIFTVLFLSYAIISLYQEVRVAILNNIILLISGIVFILLFPILFEPVDTLTPSSFFMVFILVIFVALLSITSFILIKRKRHYYRQVVDLKEQEYKHTQMIFDIQKYYTGETLDAELYYSHIEKFTDYLSEQIGIENVFSERLQIIKALAESSNEEIQKSFPEYKTGDIEELKQLELKVYKKIAYLSFKAAQLKDIQPKTREFLFEKNIESLNHRDDLPLVKIIAFSVFYTLLRAKKPYAKAMSHAEVVSLLQSRDFYNLVDDRILNVLIYNQEYFEKLDIHAITEVVSK